MFWGEKNQAVEMREAKVNLNNLPSDLEHVREKLSHLDEKGDGEIHVTDLLKHMDENRNIDLSTLSPELNIKLKEFDTSGDGIISIDELLTGLEKLHGAQQESKIYKRMLIVLLIVFLVQLACVFAMQFGAIEMSKVINSCTWDTLHLFYLRIIFLQRNRM